MNDMTPRTAPPATIPDAGLQTMWAFRLLHDDVTGESVVEMYDGAVPDNNGENLVLARTVLNECDSPSDWAKRQIVMAIDEIDY